MDETGEQPDGRGGGKRPSRRVVIAVVGAVVVLVVVAAVVVATRDGEPTITGAPGSTIEGRASTTATTATATTVVTTTTTSPTTTSGSATTAQPASDGAARPGCVNGWTVPAPGTALRVEPLDLIRRDMGITGEFQVIEMRHFISPEVPWILAPRVPFVEWWYVKAQLVGDPEFRARWLVSKRSATRNGLTAIARFETVGYHSPDWRAFLGEGEPYTIEGLPGTWRGLNYDFVIGEDGEKPGLPDEAVHCLDGT